MKLIRMLPLFAAAAAILLAPGSAAVTGPATPTNLEVVAVTETSITIAWGPSQPGEFVFLGSPKKNQVLIGWGASEDSRSAVTYRVSKDGTQVASNLTQPKTTVSVGGKTKSFRICVTAANASGQLSPQTCGTFTRQ
jgi:hypothetical protein